VLIKNLLKMNYNLTKSELEVNYEWIKNKLWVIMNIHMNTLHLSCENDVCDT